MIAAVRSLTGFGVILAAAISMILPAVSAGNATPASDSAPSKTKTKPVVLYGQIDELSYISSSAGVELTGGGLPSKVKRVSLGSAAAYSGLRPGDAVLDVKLDENMVVFDIDRKGKRYQAQVATNVNGLKKEFQQRKISYSFGDSAFDNDLKKLNGCDVVIMLDRSLSMGDAHAGCPGDLTKWLWCKQQLDTFYVATTRVLDGGFNLVLFNDTHQIRRDVTLYDLNQVFGQIKPAGTKKNMSAPLAEVLTDYFKRRKPDSKPLIVVMISDGIQNLGPPLQEVLIEQSQKMSRPKEVILTFIQIGESISAEELFDDLDRNLVAKGARYHMVDFKPFSQVRNKGILWEVCNAAKEAVTVDPNKDKRKTEN